MNAPPRESISHGLENMFFHETEKKQTRMSATSNQLRQAGRQTSERKELEGKESKNWH